MINGVPNIIHFVFGLEEAFGNRPFSIVHYLAIKSALEINKPEKIYFHYRFKPKGEWWNKAEKLVELVKVRVPGSIYGNKLHHYAHKSDVLRLSILFEHGGIYLDIDTICLRPLAELFCDKCIMAEERYFGEEFGLCNAVILAPRQNRFISLWLSSYQAFRSKGYDGYYSEHSVRVPLRIAKMYPELIDIQSEKSFFYPSYTANDLALLFEKNLVFSEAYVIHLWESISYDKYIKTLTKELIQNVNTSYNVIARKFL
jgi:hypothetical protein